MMASPTNNIAVVIVDISPVNSFSKKQPIIYLPLTYHDINVPPNKSNSLLYLRYNDLPWIFRALFKRVKNLDNYYSFWSLLNADRIYTWLEKYNMNALANGNLNKISSPAHFLLSRCLSLDELKLQLHIQ
jgi:hypothetical protein